MIESIRKVISCCEKVSTWCSTASLGVVPSLVNDSVNDHVKSTFMFVAENLNSDEYPEVVGFKGRVQKHSCFDSRMHSGMRGSANSGFIQAMASKVSETAEGARTSASDMADLIFKNLDNVSKVSKEHIILAL